MLWPLQVNKKKVKLYLDPNKFTQKVFNTASAQKANGSKQLSTVVKHQHQSLWTLTHNSRQTMSKRKADQLEPTEKAKDPAEVTPEQYCCNTLREVLLDVGTEIGYTPPEGTLTTLDAAKAVSVCSKGLEGAEIPMENSEIKKALRPLVFQFSWLDPRYHCIRLKKDALSGHDAFLRDLQLKVCTHRYSSLCPISHELQGDQARLRLAMLCHYFKPIPPEVVASGSSSSSVIVIE